MTLHGARSAHGTSTSEGGWEARANCRDVEPSWFDYPEGKGMNTAASLADDLGPGLAVCADCSVSTECLIRGVARKAWGVYGGRVLQGGKPLKMRAKLLAEVKPDPERVPGHRRPLLPCGTNAAYERHRGRGEPPCRPCSDAKAAYQRARTRKLKENAA